jgi:putative Mn2+ efflux pump MntP
MDLLTTELIAIGLSADATAVALCSGLVMPHVKFNNATKIALFFGVFQFFMTLLGWLLGSSVKAWIAVIGHWIAFGLLGGIGSKMIYEALQADTCDREKIDPMCNRTLTTLAIATSIDALAVGISLVTLEPAILRACGIIGVTTFLMSLAAVYIGHRFGAMLGSKLEIVGGLILIGIGLKILTEHLA